MLDAQLASFNKCTQHIKICCTLQPSQAQHLFSRSLYFSGMMNSACSCSIVCLLCLLTALITGLFGIIQKQVSACMVTSTMYMLAGKSNQTNCLESSKIQMVQTYFVIRQSQGIRGSKENSVMDHMTRECPQHSHPEGMVRTFTHEEPSSFETLGSQYSQS